MPKFSPIAHRTRSRFNDLQQKVVKPPSRIVPRNPFLTPIQKGLKSFSLSDVLPPVAQQSARTDLPDTASPISNITKGQHPSADDEQIVNVA